MFDCLPTSVLIFRRLPRCDSPTTLGGIVPLGCRAVVLRQPQKCFRQIVLILDLFNIFAEKLNVNAVQFATTEIATRNMA